VGSLSKDGWGATLSLHKAIAQGWTAGTSGDNGADAAAAAAAAAAAGATQVGPAWAVPLDAEALGPSGGVGVRILSLSKNGTSQGALRLELRYEAGLPPPRPLPPRPQAQLPLPPPMPLLPEAKDEARPVSSQRAPVAVQPRKRVPLTGEKLRDILEEMRRLRASASAAASELAAAEAEAGARLLRQAQELLTAEEEAARAVEEATVRRFDEDHIRDE
jgi:hypothetical protein